MLQGKLLSAIFIVLCYAQMVPLPMADGFTMFLPAFFKWTGRLANVSSLAITGACVCVLLGLFSAHSGLHPPPPPVLPSPLICFSHSLILSSCHWWWCINLCRKFWQKTLFFLYRDTVFSISKSSDHYETHDILLKKIKEQIKLTWKEAIKGAR